MVRPVRVSLSSNFPAVYLWLVRLLIFILILGFINPFVTSQAAEIEPRQQGTTPEEKARAMLDQMTPEERVGQLFVVTFTGNQDNFDSQIYDLIANHHIGGVILSSANDNFVSGDTILQQTVELNRQLQVNRWDASQQTRVDPTTGRPYTPNFIPLFIGISQEGDGAPYDQILSGLTPLPNEMALGATWNPQLTTQIGSVLGQELSSLGFNLLLGPSLDVLESPRPDDPSDLGTRTFGGDPFWVGVLGQAYIQGVHQGSNGRIAVIAKHFPGNGGADRLPEEEVATIRKNIEQLKNFDLKPFFAVTGGAMNSNPSKTQAVADGLLAAHIRYQGFQDNIRQTTRPVSLDQEKFDLLMKLPDLAVWRENGGVVLSDNLGSQAVRRFYEVTGQPYDARLVALNAFKAGNDLLYLGNVTSGEDPDSYTTTVNILNVFAQRYRSDPSFAQDVDESVVRILKLKYRLYPSFALEDLLPKEDNLMDVGNLSQVTFDVARQAATLISPPLAGLDEAIPDPPNLNDRMVFITDARNTKQCTLCQDQPVLEVGALEDAVLRLYGPQGSGQVLPGSLDSYSLEDLQKMLDDPKNSTQLENDLRRSHWIVFSILNENPTIPTSQALRRFLSERPDLFQRKRLVVFSLNAPYFLDATDISKITAYFGLYSKNSLFVDAAARMLFRELAPQGALPVSVPGVGYDLITATSPNPDQVIPLIFESDQSIQPSSTTTPEPVPIPKYQLGDQVAIRTGVIFDHNGHPVPDGTPVQFSQTVNGETTALTPMETRAGIANIPIQVTSSGTWEIRAESEPAKSEVLRFEVPSDTGEIVTITPTVTPTTTPTPTETPTLAPAAIVTPEPPATPRPRLTDWFMAILLTSIFGFLAYRLAAMMGQIRWGVRSGFLALIGGLLAYTYLTLGMPGSEKLIETLGALGILLATLLGCSLGTGAAWLWRAGRLMANPRPENKPF